MIPVWLEEREREPVVVALRLQLESARSSCCGFASIARASFYLVEGDTVRPNTDYISGRISQAQDPGTLRQLLRQEKSLPDAETQKASKKDPLSDSTRKNHPMEPADL